MSRQRERQAGREEGTQTDKQRERLTDRQTDRQTVRLGGGHLHVAQCHLYIHTYILARHPVTAHAGEKSCTWGDI